MGIMTTDKEEKNYQAFMKELEKISKKWKSLFPEQNRRPCYFGEMLFNWEQERKSKRNSL